MDLEDGRSCFLVDVARGSDLGSFRGPGAGFHGNPRCHIFEDPNMKASVI